MATIQPFSRSRRSTQLTLRQQRAGAIIERLEGRVLFAFNAYIAGLASGGPDADAAFVVSTTGQAAKQWVIDWGDLSTPTTLTAPDPVGGFTTPQTVTHHYGSVLGPFAVWGTATSVTGSTAKAVLQENSAFGNGGTNTGKTVQGLADAGSVGTSIASVLDEGNRTYVLSIDGKRMAVTRFTAVGIIDTAWGTSGTYIVPFFTGVNNQDTPKAMAIDTTHHWLFVAGGSNNMWAIARIDITPTASVGWMKTYFTGTVNALSIDSSDDLDHLAVAGTTGSGNIRMAMLHAWDNPNSIDPPPWNGGDLNAHDFATPNGLADAPNSIYDGISTAYTTITASASAIFEGDDVGFGGVSAEQWFISGTVSYSGPNAIPSSGSDMVIVDFTDDGGQLRGADWGNGHGATLFNSCNSCCVVGSALDSNYAMVASVVGTTRYLTLVGGTNSGFVLTERFEADTGLRDTTYGPLKGEGPDHTSWSSGPSGTAYAAALDNNVNKVVISGSGGNNDFLVARFNNDGTLDASFGGAGPNGPSGADGSIRIDFGPYNGITTDGARTIALRTVNGAVDILVGGYTFDTGTQKYKIALVDLLDDHFFHVT